jgi:hypothetical protein
MYRQILLIAAGWAAIAGSAHAQNLERTASFLGGGSPDRGKCTIEVVVDTAAEVEIRGNRGILRNIAGQQPQWRRFECTGALPQNPADFRFAGIDGRGRQTLVRDPRNSGGAAVIRIEDPASGSEGYTFDILWGSGYAQGPVRNDQGGGRFDGGPDQGPMRNDQGGGPFGIGRSGGGPGRRFTTEQAVQVCESSILQQAQQRFRTQNISFRGTALDDNPGRQDWVMGMFDVQRSPGRGETYRFSCSVNFDTGQVRSAQIGAMERIASGRRYGDGPGQRFTTEQAVQVCESSVRQQAEQRFRTRNISFRGTALDNNPGRQDWVMGMFDVSRSPAQNETYRFSCSVNFDTGLVRSAQIGAREGYR